MAWGGVDPAATGFALSGSSPAAVPLWLGVSLVGYWFLVWGRRLWAPAGGQIKRIALRGIAAVLLFFGAAYLGVGIYGAGRAVLGI